MDGEKRAPGEKVLKDRRAPRERGRMGTSQCEMGRAQVLHELRGAVAEQTDHVIEPRLVEPRDELPAAVLPHRVRRGDQPLAHDGLEDLREDALAERERLLLEHLSDDDDEGDSRFDSDSVHAKRRRGGVERRQKRS
eukprot:30058-Pelagococcus_subviridis.AAC.5